MPRLNNLCEFGIQSYKQHAREALLGDIARIALALKAHAQKQGTCPALLLELNPLPVAETPKDPFTGDPVIYQSDGNSLSISSPPVGNILGEIYWFARK